MKTIQIVISLALLRAADRVAHRLKMNRSALVRDALRAHLAALAAREREQADRTGYLREPDRAVDLWDQVAAWPDGVLGPAEKRRVKC